MAEKLTGDLIESIAAPAKGAVTVWDNDPKARGFGVRIFAPTQQNPDGVRSFFINYRVGGKERRHTIGKFPTWSAAAGLKRLPTIEECKALAEERDIALPVCLLDARPYDLRHTFASVGAGGGLSLPIIGKLLGHTQARTTQRYAHLADDPLKEATKTIGSVISGAGKPSAELLTIKG
jgi:hypothetical protein